MKVFAHTAVISDHAMVGEVGEDKFSDRAVTSNLVQGWRSYVASSKHDTDTPHQTPGQRWTVETAES